MENDVIEITKKLYPKMAVQGFIWATNTDKIRTEDKARRVIAYAKDYTSLKPDFAVIRDDLPAYGNNDRFYVLTNASPVFVFTKDPIILKKLNAIIEQKEEGLYSVKIIITAGSISAKNSEELEQAIRECFEKNDFLTPLAPHFKAKIEDIQIVGDMNNAYID